MIVDSTALPEQAITDIVASAFQSAGQRCSALRCLYVQEEIADEFLAMLFGALDEMQLGNPRDFTTDIGPIIDQRSLDKIEAHIEQARQEGRLLRQLAPPQQGLFCGPAVIAVDGIHDLGEEIFGPVLHVARFGSHELDSVVDNINAQGYGLTFGLHSRIDDRVQHIIDRVHAGNIYINRNQIGAVVGSQPFGGEGKSGTGPKAGGPHYLSRFAKSDTVRPTETGDVSPSSVSLSASDIDTAFVSWSSDAMGALSETKLPGPTGESNTLSTFARKHVLCLGPGASRAEEQAKRARALGCFALAVAPGVREGLNGNVDAIVVSEVYNLDAVVTALEHPTELRQLLAKRDGMLVPVVHENAIEERLILERHVCIDTTAAGGNAALMGAQTS